MSKMKSALELALERTSDVKLDRDALRKEEAERQGKILVGRFFNNPQSLNLSDEMAKVNADGAKWVRKGILEVLLANITLPRHKTDQNRLPLVNDALQMLAVQSANKEQLNHLLNKFSDLFNQYFENIEQMEEQLRNQWESRLRQKEQQIRQQTGQTVHLTPEQDPEYTTVLTEQISQLYTQYNEVLSNGKSEIWKMF